MFVYSRAATEMVCICVKWPA